MRFSFGTVDANGTEELAGSADWEVYKDPDPDKEGIYTVTFKPAFGQEPVVTCTPINDKTCTISVNDPKTSKDSFVVNTTNAQDGKPEATGFSFIAISH